MYTYRCPSCNAKHQVCTPNATVTCPCPRLNRARRTVNLCRLVNGPNGLPKPVAPQVAQLAY